MDNFEFFVVAYEYGDRDGRTGLYQTGGARQEIQISRFKDVPTDTIATWLALIESDLNTKVDQLDL